MKAIAAKMSQVGRAVGFGIPKDGRNQAQNYDYTSAASVRMSVGPQLAERGLAVSSHIEFVHREAFTNAKGNRQHHVIIRTTLNFVDSATGETMEVQGLGEGVDSGDKASAKAMTMAEKYAYVSAFTLAMGEDPERDEPEKFVRDRPDLISDEERARAQRQGDAFDAHVLAAKAMVDEFSGAVCRGDVLTWAKLHGKSFQTLPSKPKDLRARAWTALTKHIDKIADIGITANELRTEITRISKEE